MLQFSQNEFDTVMTEIDNRDAIYSPQKNIMSYTFSQISLSHDRGTAGEHFMCNKLRSQYGINAVQVGGKGNPDIEITHDDGTVSIAECKTSLLNVNGKYKFHDINPNNFDLLFFCYVHPTKFLICQTIRKVDFLAWTEIGGRGGKAAIPNADGEYKVYMTQDFKNDKGLDGIIWSERGFTM
tara:strand:- start:497 stop:1042 length:546 start_codon:yes stop_codon:yes gene_type:complete